MTGLETQITARLDASARVRADAPARLWYDTSKMHVFDADSGLKLTADDTVDA
jgi:multiple sugar transport system ATP-binding protein